MKQRIGNKLTSMLLVFCMLLSLLPGTAMAAGETEQTGTPQSVTEEVVTNATVNPLQLAESCNILSYVNENVFLQGSHIARLNAEETLSSYVFLNSDGTKTVYYLDEEVKFINTDGTVQEKDITLTAAVGGYTTACNDVILSLPTNPSSGISLVYGNYTATLIPQGGTLSEPLILENNAVTYPDYFGEGMDLVYTPTLSGVKEDIVLDSYTGVTSFTFMLNTRGLNLYQANGRYFLAPSKTSDMRIELGDIVSFDARGRFSVGSMTATTVMAGSLYRLTITVDEGFLTDENTTYPVSIDPTLTVSDNTHGAGTIEDATLYSGVPTLNTGSWTYLHCGYYDSTYKVGRIVFRLLGLVYADELDNISFLDVTSAKLFIKEAGWTAGVTVNLHEMTDAWDEDTITWSSHYDEYSPTVVASASPSYGNYAEFDITNSVRNWHYYEDYWYGFMLISTNETSVDKTLYSSEYGTADCRPYVAVTFQPDLFYSEYDSAEYYRNTKPASASTNDWAAYSDDHLQFRANCYGYAFRFYYSPKDLTPELESESMSGKYYCYKQQPGEFADKTSGLVLTDLDGSDTPVYTIYNRYDLAVCYANVFSQYYSDEHRMNFITQMMEADVETLGYTITEYEFDTSSAPDADTISGQRLIAVVVTQEDYHFYMQHSDNTWSHKPGEGQPSDKCFDHGSYLSNSNIKEHMAEGYYNNGEVKFFYITKNAVVDFSHASGSSVSCVKTVITDADGIGNYTKAAKSLGTVPKTYSKAKIDYVGDIDYFLFKTTSAGTYSFSATMECPLRVKLYTLAGAVLYNTESAAGSISFTCLLSSNAEYYIRFESPGQTSYSPSEWYSFSITSG